MRKEMRTKMNTSRVETCQKALDEIMVVDLAKVALQNKPADMAVRLCMMEVAKSCKEKLGLSFDDFAKLAILNGVACLVSGDEIEERAKNN